MNVQINILDEDHDTETEDNNPNIEENDDTISVQVLNTENSETSTLQTQNFDLNLPASHSYLGSNLEELRGRTILDDGIYINLPLVIERSIVLFPGQTLPMAVFGSNVADMLLKCIKKNRTFGVICYHKNKAELIGTTAEIYEFKQGTSQEGFRIKAKGRQRFKVLKITQNHFEISANVKIVPEIVLSHPFLDFRLTILDAQRCNIINQTEQMKQDKIKKLDAALTYWPAWVYKQYDPYRLAREIQNQLKFIETKGSSIPADPIELSFWVAQNLPLSDSERLQLLRYDCAISRLHWELNYLKNDRILKCWNCEIRIAKHSDIFPMSKEGPQSTYCNSGGFLHDTVTLYQAENLRLNREPPSSECSWFPGYAWTIATCEGCSIHMGWKFTAETGRTLNPSFFWGLTRRSLKSERISVLDDPDQSLTINQVNAMYEEIENNDDIFE